LATKTVAEKGHLKPGTRLTIVNPVQSVVDSLGLPPVDLVDLSNAQTAFLFVKDRTDLDRHMPSVASQLGPGARLWVFFRKGSKAAGLDMNRNDIWASADALDLRPVGLLSVDESWSAFRFRAPA
jgi:hypothetical protein